MAGISTHPNRYGHTCFCERFAAFEQRASTAGAAMQTDYTGHTVPVINPATGEIRLAQIFVAVLPASLYTFAYASFTRRLPVWIEGQQRALSFFGGVTKAIGCDNLKAGLPSPCGSSRPSTPLLQHSPSITTRRSYRPVQNGRRTRPSSKAAFSIERWMLARLRKDRLFSLVDLNARISQRLVDLNNRPMRRKIPTSAMLAVDGLRLRQVLVVHMHEAELLRLR